VDCSVVLEVLTAAQRWRCHQFSYRRRCLLTQRKGERFLFPYDSYIVPRMASETCRLASVGATPTHVFLLLVTANVVSSSSILVTLMEVIYSSETSVLTRATWHNIPGDGILHSHSRETPSSYIVLTG
jgi:hypothetical protein